MIPKKLTICYNFIVLLDLLFMARQNTPHPELTQQLIRTCLRSHPMDGETSISQLCVSRTYDHFLKGYGNANMFFNKKIICFSIHTQQNLQIFIASTSWFPKWFVNILPLRGFQDDSNFASCTGNSTPKNRRKNIHLPTSHIFLIIPPQKKLTFRFWYMFVGYVCVVFPAQLFFSEQKNTHSLPPKKKNTRTNPHLQHGNVSKGHISPFHPSRYWSS